MDSNHRRYKPADLQSAPFGHSGILPFFLFYFAVFCVGLRILGQSFTPVNSFPRRLSALKPVKIIPKSFFVSFGRFLRRTSHPRSSQPPGCYVVRRLSFLDSSRNILQNLVFCGLLRWTSHPRSVIYTSKLLPSLLVRLEARQNNSKIFQKTEPMEGIEPTTPRLQITCSSQLSYIGETDFERDCKDRDYF